MRLDASFASPATLLTDLLNAGRSPAELNWRFGTSSAPGKWFVAAESDLEREIVVDPRGWRDDEDVLSGLWAAAEKEWFAGARLPTAWLREQCRLGSSGDDLFDADTLQRLLPLLPRLRRTPPNAQDVGRLFGLLAQHPVAGLVHSLDVAIDLTKGTTLGETAPLADTLLRLRVIDVESEEVDRLVVAGWIASGTGSLRAPGRAARVVLDLFRHHWLRVEFELVLPDRRPALGLAVLGDTVILGRDPDWRRK